jgi:seryl-tRNA synthetase
MHDLKQIRAQPEAFDAGLARRGLEPESAKILALDSVWRAVETQAQELQAERNAKSEQIGKIKQEKGNADAVMAEVAAIKDKLTALEAEAKIHEAQLNTALAVIPNIPADDVPDGKDENGNKEIRIWGTPKNIPNAKDHADLGVALGMMDFETAAKMSGARFVILKGQLARLERALGQFMIDTHTRDFGYTECSVPVLVNANALYGTGNLPKFEEDLFKTNTGHYLIPTAEVSLTNFVNDTIVAEEQLPMRLTALSPCFRSEAGSAGRDTKGMLRQHQFYKVEMVSITAPEASEAEHERMTNAAETILQKLEIPYRTILLCTGDMGFASRKTYDIEAWLPGQQKYREISSCSNCGDFQARRMNARMKRMNAKGTEFVHTLNGSGLAVGRTLIAVMENYQQPDGSIVVPKVLQPYMGGLEKINVPTSN